MPSYTYLQTYSVDQLAAIRKLIDAMLNHLACVYGDYQAVQVLYHVSNSQQLHGIDQILQQVLYSGSMQALKELSRALGEEIDARGQ